MKRLFFFLSITSASCLVSLERCHPSPCLHTITWGVSWSLPFLTALSSVCSAPETSVIPVLSLFCTARLRLSPPLLTQNPQHPCNDSSPISPFLLLLEFSILNTDHILLLSTLHLTSKHCTPWGPSVCSSSFPNHFQRQPAFSWPLGPPSHGLPGLP